MAIDLTTDQGVVFPELGLGNIFVIPVLLDFTAINDGLTPATEEVTFLKLPAKSFIHQMQYDVGTAEGGTLTFEVGDQDGASNWFTGIDGNVVASAVSTLITAGKYFPTTGPTLRFTPNNDADAAKITIRVIVSNLGVAGNKA